MSSRSYTPEQREAALKLVREIGVRPAAGALDIPRATIARWSREAGWHSPGAEQTAAATEATVARARLLRERLRLKLLEKPVDLLDRMDKEHVEFKGQGAEQVVYPIAPAGAVRDYAVAIGILIDKYRLEVGEATTRSEHRDLDIFDDHETRALVDAARRYLAGNTARQGETVAEDGPVEVAPPTEPDTA